MRHSGTFPQGLEIGNAWDGRSTQRPETNWIVGQVASLPIGSLRFLNHSTSEQGRTLSILVDGGAFEYCFAGGGASVTLVLDRPGDFVIWGPGLEHAWQPLQRSTILTVRWQPLPSTAMPPPAYPPRPDSPGR
jgi:hypothetical protein